MNVKDIPDDELLSFFEYLDALRASAVTNMGGAGSWLEGAFDLDRKAARSVLSAWMFSYSHETSASVRVALAKGGG